MSNTHIYIHKSEVDCLLIEEKKIKKSKENRIFSAMKKKYHNALYSAKEYL